VLVALGITGCILATGAVYLFPITSPHAEYTANELLPPNEDGNGRNITGTVVAILPGPQDQPMYKLNIGTNKEEIIWASTFVPVSDGQIKVGERWTFKGYIKKAAELDPSGKLVEMIQSPSFLVARTIETPSE
jgi:hypothetical protein